MTSKKQIKFLSIFVFIIFYRFGVATSGAEAEKIANDLKTKNLILKAQVLAGGRGKGHFKNGLKGGVRVINKYVSRDSLELLKVLK